MIRGMFQGSSYYTQLVITLVIVFTMLFISSFISLGIAIPLYHLDITDLDNLMTNLNDPRTIAVLKFSQIIVSLSGFVFSALLLAYLFSGNTHQYLRMDKNPQVKFSIIAFFLVLVVFPLINMIGALNSELHFPEFLKEFENYLAQQDQTNERLMESFLADSNLRGLFVNIVMIGIIPAVGEELFFRGVVQTIFSRMTKNQHWGIWIAAVIFSLIHMQFTGFFPRVLLGAMFGYMLIWSGSMWVPIFAHFVNNVSAVIMYYFVNTGRLNKETLEYGATTDVWPFVLVSAILTATLLWYFYKHAQKSEGNSEFI